MKNSSDDRFNEKYFSTKKTSTTVTNVYNLQHSELFFQRSTDWSTCNNRNKMFLQVIFVPEQSKRIIELEVIEVGIEVNIHTFWSHGNYISSVPPSIYSLQKWVHTVYQCYQLKHYSGILFYNRFFCLNKAVIWQVFWPNFSASL